MAQSLDREALLRHLRDDFELEIGRRTVDLAEAALRDGAVKVTDFLDPVGRQVCEGILGSISGVSYRAHGGYAKAERRRLSIFPQYLLAELIEEPVTAIEVRVEKAGEELSHRDFLGALLGLGLRWEKIGDVLVASWGCQAVIALEVAEYVLSQPLRVGKAHASVEEIDLERLEVEPERVKEIRTTVASLRLDAVASSGFGTSRTRMAREIKAERVKVNWRPVRDPAAQVAQGDVLSIRGRGRVVVEEVAGTTRKGRITVVLKRYL